MKAVSFFVKANKIRFGSKIEFRDKVREGLRAIVQGRLKEAVQSRKQVLVKKYVSI